MASELFTQDQIKIIEENPITNIISVLGNILPTNINVDQGIDEGT
jgi:hypothetical protein